MGDPVGRVQELGRLQEAFEILQSRWVRDVHIQRLHLVRTYGAPGESCRYLRRTEPAIDVLSVAVACI
jgi:hypothetical protein